MFTQDTVIYTLVVLAAVGNVFALLWNNRFLATARLARTLHDLLQSAVLLTESADEARQQAQRARSDAKRLQATPRTGP